MYEFGKNLTRSFGEAAAGRRVKSISNNVDGLIQQEKCETCLADFNARNSVGEKFRVIFQTKDGRSEDSGRSQLSIHIEQYHGEGSTISYVAYPYQNLLQKMQLASESILKFEPQSKNDRKILYFKVMEDEFKKGKNFESLEQLEKFVKLFPNILGLSDVNLWPCNFEEDFGMSYYRFCIIISLARFLEVVVRDFLK